jgi:hypothetical protein
MWLTRPAFWYLPDPRFSRYLSDFGPNFDPHSLARLLDVRAVAAILSFVVRPNHGIRAPLPEE